MKQANTQALCIAMVAGEPSADLLAAQLIPVLKKCYPHARFVGIGGENMRSVGFESWWPMDELAVNGLTEIVRHLPRLIQLKKKLVEKLLSSKPSVFIGIDSPEFNLKVEQQLKQNGIPTIHYVGPSVWAWRKNRLTTIRKVVDHVLLLFPFEKSLYEQVSIAATYVGHPMADEMPLEINKPKQKKLLGYQDEPLICLMPGSRDTEVEKLAPLLIEAACQIYHSHRHVQFILPVVHQRHAQQIRSMEQTASLPLKICTNDDVEQAAKKALLASDMAIMASGTATLEAMLAKTPMVIVYRVSFLSAMLFKWLRYIPWVGLPNILAQSFIVSELLQGEAKPSLVTIEALRLLNSDETRSKLIKDFSRIHCELKQGTADRAAEVISYVINHSRR